MCQLRPLVQCQFSVVLPYQTPRSMIILAAGLDLDQKLNFFFFPSTSFQMPFCTQPCLKRPPPHDGQVSKYQGVGHQEGCIQCILGHTGGTSRKIHTTQLSLSRRYEQGIVLLQLITFTLNTDWDIHIKHGKLLLILVNTPKAQHHILCHKV